MASDNSGTSSSRLGHIIVGERLDGERFVDRRLLIFDDSENGEDLFESVVDLEIFQQVSQDRSNREYLQEGKQGGR